MIRGHLVRVLPKVLQLPNALPLSTREHCVILEAIERHDVEGARAAMQAHLEAVLRRYRNAYKVSGRLQRARKIKAYDRSAAQATETSKCSRYVYSI